MRTAEWSFCVSGSMPHSALPRAARPERLEQQPRHRVVVERVAVVALAGLPVVKMAVPPGLLEIVQARARHFTPAAGHRLGEFVTELVLPEAVSPSMPTRRRPGPSASTRSTTAARSGDAVRGTGRRRVETE
ncbi:hypothetical protein [Kibdelosporangium phytohabitans]|uniref:hypothetical protein n=1 Tax=Kibdelosporangium phytohabitans TaxID=860235 RepID=UPI0019E6F80F|nr:hypothetical protein [Kibdelosporangium phytohabitans]MBE1468950.1 hypothetical protein [Kibdelosporangium phytohabitans]